MSFVSIITPTFNSELTLVESIDSVRRQTYHDYEHLIVDDCSTDLTADIASEASRSDPRIRLIRLHENKGAAVARNAAILAAKGRFITFLDSDDIWLPHKLEKQVSFMRDNRYPFTFSAYKKINTSGDEIGVVGVPAKIDYNELLKTCVIGYLTAAYDVRYFGKVYMPLLRMRQDFGLWLALLKKTDFAYGIQEPLALYRISGSSISNDKINSARYNWKIYRDVEKLGLMKSCYYFSHYALRGVLRLKYPHLARKLGVLH